jgi:hypothetical protein
METTGERGNANDPRPGGDAGRRRRNLRYGIAIVAIAVGLKYGFDFGNQVGGVLMGVVGALNGALFCALISDYVADRLLPDGDGPSKRG